MRGYDRGGEDMVIAQGKVIRAPKVKKKQIVETELDKFLN